jgi:hypothetical protein
MKRVHVAFLDTHTYWYIYIFCTLRSINRIDLALISKNKPTGMRTFYSNFLINSKKRLMRKKLGIGGHLYYNITMMKQMPEKETEAREGLWRSYMGLIYMLRL